ncbi:MAG: adenylate/guanylate cyclase domain-containing protein [Acidimicrobiia bacterium]
MPTPNAELRAVLHRFLQSVSDNDAATTMNMLSPTAELQYVGTDDLEWWSGAEVAQVFGRHMEEVLVDFRLEISTDDIEAFSEGPVGWGRAHGLAYFGREEPLRLRTTAVFVLESGVWRAIQIHNSLGRPNEEVTGAEITSTIEELLDSLIEDSSRGLLAEAPEGMVTLVFTDIEDSTALAASLGDQKWADVIEWHDGTIRLVAEKFGGTVVKVLGDGALISFTSARGAARAALEIRSVIQGPDAPEPLRIRIGIHAGDVVHTDDDVLGTTVNKAARIASAADGGQIMTSTVVHAMLSESSDLVFGESVSAELKGLPGMRSVVPLLSQQ